MALATFDTLKYARALKAAGVPNDQAEAQSLALQDAMQVNLKDLVTKDDLKASTDELRHELKELETRFTAKLDNSTTSLRGEMTLMKWMLGVNVTVTVGVLVRLLLFRGQF